MTCRLFCFNFHSSYYSFFCELKHIIEILHQDLNFKCSFENSVAVGGNFLWLMSSEDLCNENLEVEDTSEVHKESVP